MSFIDDFQANLEALPHILQKKYSLLRDLDKSLQDLLRQNEIRCEQEIDEIKRGVKSGNVTPNTSLIRFSDEALDEQKHSIRIADEKVALATQAYDLVDDHIQQLDQYLRKFEEQARRDRDGAAAANASPAASVEGVTKSGRGGESGGRGGRKKTRSTTAVAAATEATTTVAATTANPTGMDLECPVDPSEPTYCICKQVSYGEMIACDNPDCKIEWFHFNCVGLKEKVTGKWYCPNCSSLRNRRRTR